MSVKGLNQTLLVMLLTCVLCAGCTTMQTSLAPIQTRIPAWISGQSGSFKLNATGGTPPYHCSLKQGSTLPPGFTLSDDCVISGTAPALSEGTTQSIFPLLTVIINDSSNPQHSTEVDVQLTEVKSGPQFIPATGDCIVHEPCHVTVGGATGGTPPYHYQLDSLAYGSPPLGMTLGTDGILTGTPSKEGDYQFQVCVVDIIAASNCGMVSVTVKPKTNDNPAPGQGGTCTTDQQCGSFGNRNCGGAAHALCGADHLCHCCLLLVGVDPETGQQGEGTCMDCTTCGGDTYCERDTCVFRIGGTVTQ